MGKDHTMNEKYLRHINVAAGRIAQLPKSMRESAVRLTLDLAMAAPDVKPEEPDTRQQALSGTDETELDI